jgi:hypothetical protein
MQLLEVERAITLGFQARVAWVVAQSQCREARRSGALTPRPSTDPALLLGPFGTEDDVGSRTVHPR